MTYRQFSRYVRSLMVRAGREIKCQCLGPKENQVVLFPKSMLYGFVLNNAVMYMYMSSVYAH